MSMRSSWPLKAVLVAFGIVFAFVEACNGTDTPTCPSTTQLSCNGACIDPQNDPANCGACGKACDSTSICSHSVCVSLCTGMQACAVGDGGICTNLQSDNAHCGTCDNACKPLEVCNQGKCGGGCPPNEIGCQPEAGQPYCANSQTDNANCGACGMTCGPQQVCAGGTCASSCVSGQQICIPDAGAPYCARTGTDNANCGGCGIQCDPLQVCAGGKCGNSCLSTQTECFIDGGLPDGGTTQPYCADLKNDNYNCGACGNACPNNKPLCSAGTCVPLG